MEEREGGDGVQKPHENPALKEVDGPWIHLAGCLVFLLLEKVPTDFSSSSINLFLVGFIMFLVILQVVNKLAARE